MDIGERIRYLRKSVLEQTLDEFGARIKLGKSAVSNMETGQRGVTDQTILSICREFGVSEEWLRYGEGEMMVKLTADERIANLIAEAQTGAPTSLKRRMLLSIAKLDDEDWEALARIAEKITSKNE